MHKPKKTRQNYYQLMNLLDTIKVFFIEGTIPAEQAHACTSLLQEYLKSLHGLEHDSEMIAFYELNPSYRPIMFSSEQAIIEQIDRLEDTLNMLLYLTPPRHELMMIPASASDAPPIQLITADK